MEDGFQGCLISLVSYALSISATLLLGISVSPSSSMRGVVDDADDPRLLLLVLRRPHGLQTNLVPYRLFSHLAPSMCLSDAQDSPP